MFQRITERKGEILTEGIVKRKERKRNEKMKRIINNEETFLKRIERKEIK